MKLCNKKMTFEDCELAILRASVDKAEKIQAEKNKTPELMNIIEIVEDFIRKKSLICYGGTAINNILPKEDQFYDLNVDIPDYDFFSSNALEDAKELADIYHKSGYEDVEAKAGMHHGTYKVYVNFIPVADITFIHKQLFMSLKDDSVKLDGIHYCPPNFLRMSMYLELSRPNGDVTRWEKVLKRITLLNKHYPLKSKYCNYDNFQRLYENLDEASVHDIYNIVRHGFIDQGVVFLGGYASYLYSRYMDKRVRRNFSKHPDFDVLAENPQKCANLIKERLHQSGYDDINIIQHQKMGELIAVHYEIKIKDNTVAFVYEPVGCHSYNTIKIDKKRVHIATIDTMLSFYLAFIYANRPYYNIERILCMSEYLFTVQQRNRLNQKGLLKRFTVSCYGNQPTIEDIRNEKSKKFQSFVNMKNRNNSKEYQEWFLRYRPCDEKRKSKRKLKTQKQTPKIPKTDKKDNKKTRKNIFLNYFNI